MNCIKNINNTLNIIYKTIIKKKNLKKLFYFLIINLAFMFVEVIYGLICNFLGLLTDGAHMLLDCSGVIIGLLSGYLSDFSVNDKYNFGYNRSEVIGTFINSVFLFFMAIYIVFESIERFVKCEEIYGNNLILVSFLGLIINIIGLFFSHNHSEENEFHEHHHHHPIHNNNEKEEEENKEKNQINMINQNNIIYEENHHHHHHKNENLYAIYIHILADTLGSVAVLISAFLIKYYKYYISDPICSLIISLMIFYSCIPLLKNTLKTLIHFPNKNLMQKRKNILNKLDDIIINDNNFILENFKIWQIKNNYSIVEIKIIKNLEKKKNEDINIEEHNKSCMNLQNKIVDIIETYKINEYYIEII